MCGSCTTRFSGHRVKRFCKVQATKSILREEIYMKIVVIGGGWSGCAAAITAKKPGAEVHIYEKQICF